MQVDVQIKPSLEKLAEKFQGFENILLTRLKEGLWGYGLLVERGSKMFSPVDTGRMRDSVGTSMGIKMGELSSIVQPNVEYAVYVHEGTRKMAGRPFMQWGLDAYRREGDSYIIEKIKQATEDLAKEIV